MSYTLNDLKMAAKCQPNNADLLRWAVNEIERLKCNNLKQALIMDFRGLLPETDVSNEINKIKAEAVREAFEIILTECNSFWGSDVGDTVVRYDDIRESMEDNLGKIERGEV